MANDTKQLKRTHKKPYKVGNLYFGRSSTEAGAKWIVSKSEDLSNPLERFGIGKEARNYCEIHRDQERATAGARAGRIAAQAMKGKPDPEPQTEGDGDDSEVPVNISVPSGVGMTRIIDGGSNDEIV